MTDRLIVRSGFELTIMRSKNVTTSICRKSFLAFILPILMLSGCATTEDAGRMRYELNEVRNELNALKGKLPKDTADRKLQDIQNTQESTTRSVSDLLIQMQSLTTEFRILTGRFEESRYYAEKTSGEIKADGDKLEGKIKELEIAIEDMKKKLSHPETVPAPVTKKEEVLPAEEVKPVEQGKTEEEKKTAEEPKSGDIVKTTGKKDSAIKEDEKELNKPEVKDTYMSGYQAYKEGRTVEAREKLSSVVRDYPENEYTDNARYWIAESYYKDGNYEDAILAYEEIIKKNPKSDKIPGAKLKQGLSFYALKDEKTGRIILEKLVEEYPSSEQAQTAKKTLANSAPQKKKK